MRIWFSALGSALVVHGAGALATLSIHAGPKAEPIASRSIDVEYVTSHEQEIHENETAIAEAHVTTRARHTSIKNAKPAMAMPQPSTLSEAAPPRFTMTATVTTPASPPFNVTPDEHVAAAMSGTETYASSQVTIPARRISSQNPTYPQLARDEGVEANVNLEIVVDDRGHVEQARVLTHVGYGFEEAALSAIRAFRFSAAMKDGRPARVRMPWIVQFQLR